MATTCKYSAYVSPEICSSLNVNAGEVSMEIAFISGMPNPLDVNDGVIVRVDFGQCLNECPTVPFSKIMTSVIPKSFKVMAIPIPAAPAPIIAAL